MTVAFPTLAYNVGFPNNPLDVSPTWTDLHKDVDSLTITRGRQTEDDQAQTGTCSATLADTDRSYDPGNVAGSHYPNVQPMKPVQVVFTLGATPYTMHTGWVDIQDGWVRDESDPGQATVSVPTNDAFELLANGRVGYRASLGAAFQIGYQWDQQTTGQRIVDVLVGHFVGGFGAEGGMDPAWPWSTASVAAGQATMQGVPFSGADSKPLDWIRQAELTEPGFFVFGGDGLPRFFDRHYRQTAPSLATFCDKANLSGARVPYASVTTRRSSVVTDARTTRTGGVLQQAEQHVDALGRRVGDYSTEHLDDATAALYNQFQLNAHSTSYELLESLTLVPGTDNDTWVQVLSREVGDRITVIRTPQGVGAAVVQDYYIEGLSFTWGPGATASCTWRLSAAAATQGWQIGRVGASEIGLTTKVGW